jgi:hypothetical protein
VSRQTQADEHQGAAERVAILADIAQLVNQVEKREKAQQRDEDQQRRVEHLASDVAGESLHAVRRLANQLNIDSRR